MAFDAVTILPHVDDDVELAAGTTSIASTHGVAWTVGKYGVVLLAAVVLAVVCVSQVLNSDTLLDLGSTRRLNAHLSCVADRSDLRLREEPKWCWEITNEGQASCESSYTEGNNGIRLCYWFVSPTTGSSCKGEPEFTVCSEESTTTMAPAVPITCASLFSKSNLRQQNKWCWQVSSQGQEACDNSYISTLSGEFRPCYWDTDAGTCKSAEKVACTPKRGHALGKRNSVDHCTDMQLLGPNHWFYNWGPLPNEAYAACAETYDSGFIPQFWGGNNILTKSIWTDSDAILGFNEPDNHEEADLPATDAAALWPQIEQRALELGIPRIGSPATTTATVTGGNKQMKWYDDFFQACQSCKVDFLVVHMYKTNIATAKQTLTDLYNRYQLPIWVKEFNAGGRWSGLPMEDHLRYMQHLVPFMEEAPFIERYAWMSARNNLYEPSTLIDPNTNQLTQLGELYKVLPMNVGK